MKHNITQSVAKIEKHLGIDPRSRKKTSFFSIEVD